MPSARSRAKLSGTWISSSNAPRSTTRQDRRVRGDRRALRDEQLADLTVDRRRDLERGDLALELLDDRALAVEVLALACRDRTSSSLPGRARPRPSRGASAISAFLSRSSERRSSSSEITPRLNICWLISTSRAAVWRSISACAIELLLRSRGRARCRARRGRRPPRARRASPAPARAWPAARGSRSSRATDRATTLSPARTWKSTVPRGDRVERRAVRGDDAAVGDDVAHERAAARPSRSGAASVSIDFDRAEPVRERGSRTPAGAPGPPRRSTSIAATAERPSAWRARRSWAEVSRIIGPADLSQAMCLAQHRDIALVEGVRGHLADSARTPQTR